MRGVGAIILAAGGASRFGRAKQLLLFEGESLVRRAVRSASEAGCKLIIVVVGEARDSIIAELQDTRAITIENPEWQRGLGTSIRCGVRHALNTDPELQSVVLLACDQPFVDASIITSLVREKAKSGRKIVTSVYADTTGIPTLFDREYFGALLALSNDAGAKTFVRSHPHDVAQVPFEKGAYDIDTVEDFERIGGMLEP